MKRLMIVIGGSMAAGYVLGARAGRQRYEQIRDVASRVTADPRVHEATQKVAGVVNEKAPFVKDKLGGRGGEGAAADSVADESLVFVEPSPGQAFEEGEPIRADLGYPQP